MTNAERYALIYAVMGRSFARQAAENTLGARLTDNASVRAECARFAERVQGLRDTITDADSGGPANAFCMPLMNNLTNWA